MNPWNTAETANAINNAVTMPKEVKAENHETLFRYVGKYTSSHWVRLCSFSFPIFLPCLR